LSGIKRSACVRGWPCVLLALLVTFAACAVRSTGNPVPFTVHRDVALVTVRVGDVEIPRIMLDTGMPYDGLLIYNPAYRDSLDLTRAARARIGGAGSGEAATALLLDSAGFRIGQVAMAGQRVILLGNDAFKGSATNGVVGYSLFGHYVTELDYDARVMTLHGPGAFVADGGWRKVPLSFKGNDIPWIDIAVAVDSGPAVTLAAYIDLASREAVEVLVRPGMKVAVPKGSGEQTLGTGLSGEIKGSRGRVATLAVGGLELKDVSAVFVPAAVRSKQEGADAVIGSAALRRFNLVFDYSGRALYIKPNSHFHEPFE
jgi:hypothetical protein